MSRRLRAGLSSGRNWLQLTRFLLVGASGALANLGTYALAVHAAGLDYRLAAFLAVIAGVSNNFFWHRRWTFAATQDRAQAQALRFITVYGVTFLVGLAILAALVGAGTARVPAQAISQVLVTPLNFLGLRYWSFRVRGPGRADGP